LRAQLEPPLLDRPRVLGRDHVADRRFPSRYEIHARVVRFPTREGDDSALDVELLALHVEPPSARLDRAAHAEPLPHPRPELAADLEAGEISRLDAELAEVHDDQGSVLRRDALDRFFERLQRKLHELAVSLVEPDAHVLGVFERLNAL